MLNFWKNKHQPREFTYKPRFYNPEKEALRERVERRERIRESSQQPDAEQFDGNKNRIANHFEEYRRTRRSSKSILGNSTLRLVVIFVILLYFAYTVLDRWLPALMQYWFPEGGDY